jgi:hypothetical protein
MYTRTENHLYHDGITSTHVQNRRPTSSILKYTTTSVSLYYDLLLHNPQNPLRNSISTPPRPSDRPQRHKRRRMFARNPHTPFRHSLPQDSDVLIAPLQSHWEICVRATSRKFVGRPIRRQQRRRRACGRGGRVVRQGGDVRR